jgi:hypothetical protein
LSGEQDERALEQVLVEPIHPFGGLATSGANSRPMALRHRLTTVLPVRGRRGFVIHHPTGRNWDFSSPRASLNRWTTKT